MRVTPLLFLLTVLTNGLSAMPVINEVLAVNGGSFEDKDGDFSDWIELYNPTDEPISLKGSFLTDDPDVLTKWELSSNATIAAGGFFLLVASGKDANSIFSSEVHTNFSLSGEGEFLALVAEDGETIISKIEPTLPEQYRDVSYGLNAEGDWRFFAVPTPGTENGMPAEGVVEPVKLNVKRGFYDDPFQLELTSATPDAEIRYSLTGVAPTSLFTGKTYSAPITIDRTTTLRVFAKKAGWVNTSVKTHTFIFIDDVIGQSEMSSKVTGDEIYGALMRDALLAYPSVSLVLPDQDISKTDEDSVSVEWLDSDGAEGFQIDAGVKRVGGHSLNAYPKNNMRLYFRSKYGKEKLKFPLFKGHRYTDQAADSFDQLQLRGGSHDSVFYLGSNQQSPSNAQYVRNRWMNDMQLIMGHESTRGRWCHVYINGTYWGHYQIMERPTQGFYASYLGGAKDDYVAINKGQPIGDSDARPWTEMRTSASDYEIFARWADVDNYIDYMLLNYYAGNDWDWNPEQNWNGGGSVEIDQGGMKFIAWDSDIIFRRTNDNNLGKGGPHNMFPTLMQNDEFRIRVVDRIQELFIGDGLLTPERAAEPYNVRAEEIRLSIVPETARWRSGAWTRDDQWQAELDRLNNDFFPNRTAEVLKQFKSKGWASSVTAPSIAVENSEVTLSKSLFAVGAIHVTTDGTDPRLEGGELSASASAYKWPLVLTETTTVKARIWTGADWSALVEETVLVGSRQAQLGEVVLTKIHYRPASSTEVERAAGFNSRGDFEFVEILNRAEASISLAELRFAGGIRFQFEDVVLAPGEAGFLVANVEAFRMRYGADGRVIGAFVGSLSNEGELLRLDDTSGRSFVEVSYDDREPWPEEADGDGRYLVLTSSEAPQSDSTSWRLNGPSDLPLIEATVSDAHFLASIRILSSGNLMYSVHLSKEASNPTVEQSMDLEAWVTVDPVGYETVGETEHQFELDRLTHQRGFLRIRWELE